MDSLKKEKMVKPDDPMRWSIISRTGYGKTTLLVKFLEQ